jgi:hypothetical protein
MPKKNFKEVMFEDLSFADISKDGLIYRFKAEDIEQLLAGLPQNKIGWYFNTSLDRLCAEKHGEFIFVNPSKVSEIKGLPILFGIDKE